MALNLSKDEKEKLERDLEFESPYNEDDEAIRTLDGEININKIRATMAKKFLDMDRKDREGA